MNDILFEVIKAVIVLAIVLLVRYAVPFLKNLIKESEHSWLVDWVTLAVKSAEQTIEKTGPEKKAIVTKFIKNLLIKKNISISDEQIDVLIEAIVFEMKKE